VHTFGGRSLNDTCVLSFTIFPGVRASVHLPSCHPNILTTPFQHNSGTEYWQFKDLGLFTSPATTATKRIGKEDPACSDSKFMSEFRSILKAGLCCSLHEVVVSTGINPAHLFYFGQGAYTSFFTDYLTGVNSSAMMAINPLLCVGKVHQWCVHFERASSDRSRSYYTHPTPSGRTSFSQSTNDDKLHSKYGTIFTAIQYKHFTTPCPSHLDLHRSHPPRAVHIFYPCSGLSSRLYNVFGVLSPSSRPGRA
jgi:hypothetical protein